MNMIDLTQDENRLYQRVLSFDLNEDFETRISKLESVKDLTESLLKRKAIPEQRIKYFTDKELQTGRKHKSRQQDFESNGTKGDDIFRHPDFIKYLTYFIEGASIGSQHDIQIREIVAKNYYQDEAIEEIMYYLKSNSLLPSSKLDRDELADELFKLAVDLKIETYYCHHLRSKVRR